VLISVRPRAVKELELANGKSPFREWFGRLRDAKAKAAIRVRITKIELEGHFGKYRALGDSVFELKIDLGPGYRVYFGLDGDDVILLIQAGDKGSQERDIRKAKTLWASYLAQKEER